MVVTWGPNQVNYFSAAAGGTAPAAGTAGSTTAATAPGTGTPAAAAAPFSFGGTPSTAPTPATSSFGGATTPAPGTGVPAQAAPFSFGGTPSTAPAPAATGFGATPAAASGSSSVFGTTPAASSASSSVFGTSAPAATSFGIGAFGSTTTSTPAAAPSTSLFGATPTPAPSTGGLFGASTPAPSTGLFSSTPAPSTGLFGAPTQSAGGLFGAAATAPSTTIPPAGLQTPAHLAMQAHYDALARQEAAKLQAALETYYKAYTGAPAAAADSSSTNKFATIVYSDITPEQRQAQWLWGNRVLPPKPPTVSDKEWLEAIVRNPDPESYQPVALVGAVELQTRLAWQQDRANSYAQNLKGLKDAQATLQQRCDRIDMDLQSLLGVYTALRTRLLAVMQRVEVARCMNLPLQQDEVTLKRRLVETYKQVNQLTNLLATAQAKARGQAQQQEVVPVVNVPDERELARVLKGHRETLSSMTKSIEKDQRDLSLLKEHVISKVALPPPYSR